MIFFEVYPFINKNEVKFLVTSFYIHVTQLHNSLKK